MTVAYSTVTAKGQVTLPAAFRERFSIRAGQKVAISADEQGIRINTPPSIAEVRNRLKEEMIANGTWGMDLGDPVDAWAEAAVERNA